MFKLWKKLSLAILAMILVAAAAFSSFAAVKEYENTDTGRDIYADDAGELLTDDELEELTDVMAYVADYCNAVFFTTRSNDMESSTKYAETHYKELFGEEAGTVFLIDLDKNYVSSVSVGEVDSLFRRDGAIRITDAGKPDISAGRYYEGAVKAFWEAYLMLTEHYDPEIYEELMKNPSPFAEEEENPIVRYVNEDTGFIVMSDDTADLFDEAQMNEIVEHLIPITDVTNAAFFAIDENEMYSTEEYAAALSEQLFDEEGVLVLVDLGYRETYVYSVGEVNEEVLTPEKCGKIAEDGASLAADGDYLASAETMIDEVAKAFGIGVEENQLLRFTNEENQYSVVVDDRACLMTQAERRQLEKDLQPVTEFGNAVVVTVDSNPYGSTPKYAERLYHELFAEKSSGSLLLIDMDERYIYIFSDGENYNIVSRSRAEVITDNCYKYATKKDYYTCAKTAFEQINDLLNGRKIAQPMKYFSNAVLALLLALIINYIRIGKVTSLTETTSRTMAKSVKPKFVVGPEITMTLLRTTKTKIPHSSGGGGGFSGGGGYSGGHSSHSSSHSSGGSRSSGGHSGGGGGHRF